MANQSPSDSFRIHRAQVELLLDYLVRLPFREVAPLVDVLRGLSPISETVKRSRGRTPKPVESPAAVPGVFPSADAVVKDGEEVA